MSKINVKFTTENEEFIPAYAKEGDAGFDVYSAEDYTLAPDEWKAFKTGWRIAIPKNHVMLSCSRSGNAVKSGIVSHIAPGVIDSGYRGECFACVRNVSKEPKEIKRGDRIAQFVIVPFASATFEKVEELDETDRGEGGFGSTGGM